MERKEWFAEWFDSKYYHILYKNRNHQEAEAFLSKLIDDALMLDDESKKNRKPRKRKVKSPDELVSKLKYCVEDELTKFKSVLIDSRPLHEYTVIDWKQYFLTKIKYGL